jgi:hypothetical protein
MVCAQTAPASMRIAIPLSAAGPLHFRFIAFRTPAATRSAKSRTFKQSSSAAAFGRLGHKLSCCSDLLVQIPLGNPKLPSKRLIPRAVAYVPVDGLLCQRRTLDRRSPA